MYLLWDALSRKRWQGRGEHSKIINKFWVHFGHEAVETLEEGIRREVEWLEKKNGCFASRMGWTPSGGWHGNGGRSQLVNL